MEAWKVFLAESKKEVKGGKGEKEEREEQRREQKYRRPKKRRYTEVQFNILLKGLFLIF